MTNAQSLDLAFAAVRLALGELEPSDYESAAWELDKIKSALTARDEQIREALQELNHCGSDGAERSIAYARDILSKGDPK